MEQQPVVGSGLVGGLLSRETDSSRPCAQTEQNPHLWLFTEGRQDHGKGIISMVESTISNSSKIKEVVLWEVPNGRL